MESLLAASRRCWFPDGFLEEVSEPSLDNGKPFIICGSERQGELFSPRQRRNLEHLYQSFISHSYF